MIDARRAEPASTVHQLLEQQQQQQPESRGQKGAAECDEAIGSLRNARTKAAARSRSKFAETTLYERAEKLVMLTANGARAVVMFTVGIPGNVARFIALPKEDRRATYKRWWIATKKEANHYWVRLCSSSVLVTSLRFRAALETCHMHVSEQAIMQATLTLALPVGLTDVTCHSCSPGVSFCLRRSRLPFA